MAAARFVWLLSATDVTPNCDRQVRPLLGLPPSDALTAWRLAVERASSGAVPLSGRLVEACALEVMGRSRIPRIQSRVDSNDGGSSNTSSTGNDGNKYHGEAAGHSRRAGLHLFLSSKTPERYTPISILELVREVFALGGIDLDPCSSATSNKHVWASCYFDSSTDGLL